MEVHHGGGAGHRRRHRTRPHDRGCVSSTQATTWSSRARAAKTWRLAAKQLDVDVGRVRQHRCLQSRERPGVVPAPPRHPGQRALLRCSSSKDPRTFTLTDLRHRAGAYALDATVVSAVLTVQIVGDHLRSGGSVINVVPASPRRRQRRSCGQGSAQRLDRRSGLALRHPRNHRQRHCPGPGRRARLRRPG